MRHLTALPPPHDRAISLDGAVSILTRILDHDARALRSESHCDVRTRVRLLFSVAAPAVAKRSCSPKARSFYCAFDDRIGTVIDGYLDCPTHEI